jgi:glycosyltransferase involved in cell wall biosynthesis
MSGSSISVIIPVRDGARYLEAAIDSVLQQERAAAEVLVLDDGSTDASPAIASGFGPPVRCIRRPPRGIGAARNAALSEAVGGLVAFLDADDLWTERALAVLGDRLDRDPQVALVFGHVRQFISPDIAPELAARLKVPPGAEPGYLSGGLLTRRTVFAQVGQFREDLVSGEAVDWIVRTREAGIREVLAPEHVLWRRVHGENHGRRHMEARVDYVRVARAALRRRSAPGSGDAP